MGRTGDHERERRSVARLVDAGLAMCPRCGGWIIPGEPWDLDHVDVPYVDGGDGRRLPAHRKCNRKAGSLLGHQRKRARRAGELARETSMVQWLGMGVEVAADRRQTWVCQAGVNWAGHVVVRLLDPLDGSLVAGQITRLWERLPSPVVGIDPRSPSATLVEPLQAEGVPLKLADARGMATAHGHLLDLLAAGRLRVRGHQALDAAARQAVGRRLAGGEAVDRYSGPDLAPLVAAELAVWVVGDTDTAEGLRPDQVTAAVVGAPPDREAEQARAQQIMAQALGFQQPPPAPPARPAPPPPAPIPGYYEQGG